MQKQFVGMPVWIYMMPIENLGNMETAGGDICTSGKTCYYWLTSHIKYMGYGENMVYKLDEYIDKSDGLDKGKFRTNWFLGDKTDPIIFYQLAPTMIQP